MKYFLLVFTASFLGCMDTSTTQKVNLTNCGYVLEKSKLTIKTNIPLLLSMEEMVKKIIFSTTVLTDDVELFRSNLEKCHLVLIDSTCPRFVAIGSKSTDTNAYLYDYSLDYVGRNLTILHISSTYFIMKDSAILCFIKPAVSDDIVLSKIATVFVLDRDFKVKFAIRKMTEQNKRIVHEFFYDKGMVKMCSHLIVSKKWDDLSIDDFISIGKAATESSHEKSEAHSIEWWPYKTPIWSDRVHEK